jgi:hypothetical protein
MHNGGPTASICAKYYGTISEPEELIKVTGYRTNNWCSILILQHYIHTMYGASGPDA